MQMANFLCNIFKNYTEETLVRNITAMFREQCPHSYSLLATQSRFTSFSKRSFFLFET